MAMKFHLNKVDRLHTHGELSIEASGNSEEAFSLLDFNSKHILSVLTAHDEKKGSIVNDRVIADAALHSVADELWMIANDLAKCSPTDLRKMQEIQSRARGVMMTYAFNSKQEAFEKTSTDER